ncbi:acyl-homoserine-lactone synthase [Pseudodonghicola xiamenensis]|uniref:Acyl-homoserine-lactone synthase n=1 Tax=Pseudodonghicola xiamenensis TaxID=337702 RepID=A0A8J3H2W6_9RHOB|nr:acyl-homoserine-lactone synthase [Pseudodonghicola xiamenensis]GHG79722.1 hypothetical protein GCM10010961_02050 [Pseudodonghicola xiamenensis]
MIIVIDGLNKHKFPDILDEMYRLRARVFEGRLGWDVHVTDGKEIDEFDALDPAHVVCLDEDGDVVGCMRLLQTTGPHMLADVFYQLLDGEPPLRSSRIWEATRFCVDTKKLTGTKKRNSISYVTSEVMVGAFEYAREAGVLDAVAVIDPVMNRVMKRSRNAPYDYLGTPKPMGVVTAMAALMDCSDERIDGIREFAGIDHDVFLTDDQARALFDKTHKPAPIDSTGDDSLGALQQYCYEQVTQADSPEEMNAALALAETLSRNMGIPPSEKLKQLSQARAERRQESSIAAPTD